eukprot:1288088-Prymnesium_polylepis.2
MLSQRPGGAGRMYLSVPAVARSAPPVTSALLSAKVERATVTFELPLTSKPPPDGAWQFRIAQSNKLRLPESTPTAPAECPRRTVRKRSTVPPNIERALPMVDTAFSLLVLLVLPSMLQSESRRYPPSTLSRPTSRTFKMCTRGASAVVMRSGRVSVACCIVAVDSPIIHTCAQQTPARSVPERAG